MTIVVRRATVDDAAAFARIMGDPDIFPGFEIEGRHRGYAMRDGALVDVYAMARLHPSPPGLPLPLAGEGGR